MEISKYTKSRENSIIIKNDLPITQTQQPQTQAFALGIADSMGLGKYTHHCRITQDSVTVLKTFRARLVHLSVPNPGPFHCLRSRAFSRLSHSRSHTACGPFRLASSRWHLYPGLLQVFRDVATKPFHRHDCTPKEYSLVTVALRWHLLEHATSFTGS